MRLKKTWIWLFIDCKHMVRPDAECSTVALHVCVSHGSNPVLNCQALCHSLSPAMRGHSVPCFTDALVWRHMGLQGLELAQKALGVSSPRGHFVVP